MWEGGKGGSGGVVGGWGSGRSVGKWVAVGVGGRVGMGLGVGVGLGRGGRGEGGSAVTYFAELPQSTHHSFLLFFTMLPLGPVQSNRPKLL